MKTKAFMLLLVGVLMLGGGIGGAFASGMAIGKSQGKDAAQKTLAPLSPSGSGQQTQGQLTEEQLQQFRQQFQGQSGQTGQDGAQVIPGRGGLTGTVEKIEGNTLTVNTAQGPLQATIGADTTIQMSVQGTAQDLKTGLRVTVVGQRGQDGNVAATSIIITPAGVDGLFGGGSNPGGSQ